MESGLSEITPMLVEYGTKIVGAVKQHLEEAGIGIPLPQMDVHVDGRLGD